MTILSYLLQNTRTGLLKHCELFDMFEKCSLWPGTKFSALSLHSEMWLRFKGALRMQENAMLKHRVLARVGVFNPPLEHNLVGILISIHCRIIFPCKCPYWPQRTLMLMHIYVVHKSGFWNIYRWANDLQDVLEVRAQWWKHQILACLRSL